MRISTNIRNWGEGSEPETLLACVRAAEAGGIGTVWVNDRLSTPAGAGWKPTDGGRYLDPLMTLAYLASATERIGLGTGVLNVPYRLPFQLVKQVATAQDVGHALNPLSVVGQIEGGIAQGVGLAVMEEIIQVDGVIRNGNFTDYLLPTFLDMPTVEAVLIEEPDPHAPLGAKGVGEPPTISSTPAVVAAIRDALRRAGRERPLHRVPVRPEDICL